MALNGIEIDTTNGNYDVDTVTVKFLQGIRYYLLTVLLVPLQ